MTVGELKKRLQDVPDDQQVVVTTGWCATAHEGYYDIAVPVRKAKRKLVKEHGKSFVVQSRPKKDETATIAFVIEN